MDTTELSTILKRFQPAFHPVVPFNPADDKIAPMDFSAANKEITDDILVNTSVFTAYIINKLRTAGAKYGIGGYGEHRVVYKASKVFDASVAGEEPRRLHLGTDIWGKPNTAVLSPVDGIVHSFAFNNRLGDYGATIILSHRIDNLTFYTLYGHLSLNSIRNMQEGVRVEKGEVFAEFGIPSENGQWPPHLHFQIIFNIGTWRGDYPGVCKFSEKEQWLANSPDPDIMLQLNQYLQQ